jgi:hypothetical protein
MSINGTMSYVRKIYFKNVGCSRGHDRESETLTVKEDGGSQQQITDFHHYSQSKQSICLFEAIPYFKITIIWVVTLAVR